MNWKRISIAACLVMNAACSGSSEGIDAAKAYPEMSFEDRLLFMNDVVLPRMKTTFAAFDPKYASMTCGTCHGDGVDSGTYAMPNARVPRLPATEEEFLEYIKDPEKARWSQFMADKVWPEMAGLLNVKMFDPATHEEGFSCSNCHKAEGH